MTPHVLRNVCHFFSEVDNWNGSPSSETTVSLSAGAAAGIAVAATVVCFALLVAAVLVVRRRRSTRGYRRLEPNTLLDPSPENYGSVVRTSTLTNSATPSMLRVNEDGDDDDDNQQ